MPGRFGIAGFLGCAMREGKLAENRLRPELATPLLAG
jgi:hypothetical protein